MNYKASREKMVNLEKFLKERYGIADDELKELILNLYEIDENCEKLLEIVHRQLLPAAEKKNADKLTDAFNNYDMRLNHLNDHMGIISGLLSDTIKRLRTDPVNKK